MVPNWSYGVFCVVLIETLNRNLFMDTIGLGIVIDPDALARTINAENPEKVRVSADKEVIRVVNDCIRQRYDFCVETTLAGGNVIRQMKAAKKLDIKSICFMLDLSMSS
jgi:predicted ABC-type ATPase